MALSLLDMRNFSYITVNEVFPGHAADLTNAFPCNRKSGIGIAPFAPESIHGRELAEFFNYLIPGQV